MRTLLIILGAVMVISMLGGVAMVLRVIAAKTRRMRELEQAEADEILRRYDERLAERERAAQQPATIEPPPPGASQPPPRTQE